MHLIKAGGGGGGQSWEMCPQVVLVKEMRAIFYAW